eukprot:240137-Prymnesium_polylepis.1
MPSVATLWLGVVALTTHHPRRDDSLTPFSDTEWHTNVDVPHVPSTDPSDWVNTPVPLITPRWDGFVPVADSPQAPMAGSAPRLPAVDCVRYLALNGSSASRQIEAQLRSLGLWSRTIVQLEQPDPFGTVAGHFLAHLRAWSGALTGGCQNLMVLEDGVTFDEASLDAAEAHANEFVGSTHPYDMLLLGWQPAFLDWQSVGRVELEAPSDVAEPCVYRIHHWGALVRVLPQRAPRDTDPTWGHTLGQIPGAARGTETVDAETRSTRASAMHTIHGHTPTDSSHCARWFLGAPAPLPTPLFCPPTQQLDSTIREAVEELACPPHAPTPVCKTPLPDAVSPSERAPLAS